MCVSELFGFAFLGTLTVSSCSCSMAPYCFIFLDSGLGLFGEAGFKKLKRELMSERNHSNGILSKEKGRVSGTW